ncbi:MAG: MFS transporter [Rickettsiales bacterium]|nr:MAG: MFS transporter [Rickettsiales bacterium]
MIPKKSFCIIWIFGLMSGFTLMISSYTLNYWLSIEKINIKTIGAFSLISIPYAINFMWAPILDTKKIPVIYAILGAKLSWLLVIQFMLGICVYILSNYTPTNNLTHIAVFGILVSFFSSSQDSLLGAMRTEIVSSDQQGEISGIYIFGYRIGMLLSSSGVVYISQYLSWNMIYKLYSIIILFFPIILICLLKKNTPILDEPYLQKKHDVGSGNYFQKLYKLINTILKPVGNTKYIILILTFLILYKMPDNFINMMLNPFLHHIGYNALEISTAGKLFGAISAMIGGLLASYIMKKKSLYKSLLLFGFIHALAHLLYIYQEFSGKNIYILFIITGFEGVTSGMTMAAYIAFIASLCTGRYRATQYSFFSSMMGLSRSIFPSISGYIVAHFDWNAFYLFTSIATIPALLLIMYLDKNRLKLKLNEPIND